MAQSTQGTEAKGVIVDADGHVLEPRDLWKNYLEPQYRDRAICIQADAKGEEVLLVDGKPVEILRHQLAALGGIELDPDEIFRNRALTYEDGCPLGSYDPKARLAVMDREGIDVAILYPTIGICWEGPLQDAELATAYTRAYNRWIADFCRHDPKRLVAAAHISLLDPERAVAELERAREDGCRGIFLSPDRASRGGLHLNHPSFDPFWAAAQDLQMPVGFHVIVRDQPSFNYVDPFADGGTDFGLFNFAFLAIDVMAAFTEIISVGVLERFPRLKIAVLETGANWISAWLDRLDHKFVVTKSRSINKSKPSEYFYRQCLVAADPDETLTAAVVEHIGADYFLWASDYPHIDADFGVVKDLKERLAPLPLADQRKVLGENALRFYGLE